MFSPAEMRVNYCAPYNLLMYTYAHSHQYVCFHTRTYNIKNLDEREDM